MATGYSDSYFGGGGGGGTTFHDTYNYGPGKRSGTPGAAAIKYVQNFGGGQSFLHSVEGLGTGVLNAVYLPAHAAYLDIRQNPESLLSGPAAPLAAAVEAELRGQKSQLVSTVAKPIAISYHDKYSPIFHHPFRASSYHKFLADPLGSFFDIAALVTAPFTEGGSEVLRGAALGADAARAGKVAETLRGAATFGERMRADRIIQYRDSEGGLHSTTLSGSPNPITRGLQKAADVTRARVPFEGPLRPFSTAGLITRRESIVRGVDRQTARAVVIPFRRAVAQLHDPVKEMTVALGSVGATPRALLDMWDASHAAIREAGGTLSTHMVRQTEFIRQHAAEMTALLEHPEADPAFNRALTLGKELAHKREQILVKEGLISQEALDTHVQRQLEVVAGSRKVARTEKTLGYTQPQANYAERRAEYDAAVAARDALTAQQERYYHISPSKNRASIEQRGLLAREAGLGDPNERYVWAFKDREQAVRQLEDRWHGSASHPEPNDLWEIDPSGVEFIVDPHGYKHGYAVVSDIPPSALRRISGQEAPTPISALPETVATEGEPTFLMKLPKLHYYQAEQRGLDVGMITARRGDRVTVRLTEDQLKTLYASAKERGAGSAGAAMRNAIDSQRGVMHEALAKTAQKLDFVKNADGSYHLPGTGYFISHNAEGRWVAHTATHEVGQYRELQDAKRAIERAVSYERTQAENAAPTTDPFLAAVEGDRPMAYARPPGEAAVEPKGPIAWRREREPDTHGRDILAEGGRRVGGVRPVQYAEHNGIQMSIEKLGGKYRLTVGKKMSMHSTISEAKRAAERAVSYERTEAANAAKDAAATDPVAPGFTRLYRGDSPNRPEGDFGAWYTTNPKYAQRYGNQIRYVDLPTHQVPTDFTKNEFGVIHGAGEAGGPADEYILPPEIREKSQVYHEPDPFLSAIEPRPTAPEVPATVTAPTIPVDIGAAEQRVQSAQEALRTARTQPGAKQPIVHVVDEHWTTPTPEALAAARGGVNQEKTGFYLSHGQPKGLRAYLGLKGATPQIPDIGLKNSEFTRLITGDLILHPELISSSYLRAAQWKTLSIVREWALTHSKPLNPERVYTRGADEGYSIILPPKVGIPHDLAHAEAANEMIANLERGVHDTAEHVQQVNEAVAQMLPKSLETKRVDELIQQGARQVPNWVARTMRREMTHSTSVGAKVFNKYMDVWRALVLNWRPAWLVNNIFGQHLLYALHNPAGIRAYLQSLQLEKGDRPLAEIRKFNLRVPRAQRKFVRVLKEHPLGHEILYGATESMAPAIDRALAKGTASTIRRVVSKLNVGRALRYANVEFADNQVRTAAFIRALETMPEHKAAYAAAKGWEGIGGELKKLALKGTALPERALGSNATLEEYINSLSEPQVRAVVEHMQHQVGNFMELSPIEQKYLRTIFPFYSWFKVITTISLRLGMHDPLRVATLIALEKAAKTTGIGIPLGPQPSYLQGSVAVGSPSPTGVQPVLSTTGLNPFQTISQLTAATAATVGSGQPKFGTEGPLTLMNPLVGVTLQTAGFDPFYGGVYKGPGAGYGFKGRLASSLITNLPQYRTAEQIRPGLVGSNYKSTLYANSPLDFWINFMGLPLKQVRLQEAKTRAQAGQ